MLHPNMPVYLREVKFSTEKKDGETRKIVACTLMVSPFTAAMAEELGSGFREHVFKRTDGEPLDQLAEAKFKVNVPLQELRIKMAPDQPAETVFIQNVRVDPEFKVRRDKETPTIEATFWIDFAYPTPEILMFLANQQNEQIICSFHDQQLNMLDEQRTEEEKKPRLKKQKEEQPALEGATT